MPTLVVVRWIWIRRISVYGIGPDQEHALIITINPLPLWQRRQNRREGLLALEKTGPDPIPSKKGEGSRL